MSIRSSIVLAALVLPAVTFASAEVDQTVLGKSFAVKDPQPYGDPALRTVVVLGRELSSDDTVVGDPSQNGATIEVVANGATSWSQTFTLPAGLALPGGTGWKTFRPPTTGWLYKDALGVNGPVKSALVKRASSGMFLVKVVIKGALGPGPQPHLNVLPPAPGTDGGVRVTLNGGDTYCVTFGGAAAGAVINAPSRGVPNKAFKVVSKDDAPTVEAGCSTLTVGTTTTTTIPSGSVSFAADVQPIFTARCASAGCHGAFPQQGLDLTTGNAYASLDPGVALSTECGTKLRIDPGAPATSYVFQKLQGFASGCFVGGQMPASGGPLGATDMSTISTWITQGAANN